VRSLSSRVLAAAAVVALGAFGLAGPASGQIPKPFGSFVATRSADAVDGTSSSGAFSTAADPTHPEAAVAWRCMADGLNVIYMFGDTMGDTTDTHVSVRSGVDNDAMSEPQTWTLLRGHRAAHLPIADVEAFTARAMSGLRLALHVTDDENGRTVRDEFSLQGLSGALDYILPCGATAAGGLAITPRLRR